MPSNSPEPKKRSLLLRTARLIGSLIGIAALIVVAASIFLQHEPFEIPAAYRAPVSTSTQSGLQLRYTGVTGYEVTDGQTVILLDPVHSRPTIWDFVTAPIYPDEAALARIFPRADFILVNHAHHDHGADAPAIARRTGAVIVGTKSVGNFARARGVPEAQIREVSGGERLTLGTFTVRVGRTEHAPLLGIRKVMVGTIEPDAGPLHGWRYLQDGTLIFHLDSANRSLLFHPAVTYAAQELPAADTIIFGVAGGGLSQESMQAMQTHTQPRLLIATHYDNFFQPRELGLAWLPTIDFEAVCKTLDKTRAELPWWLLDYDQTVDLPTR